MSDLLKGAASGLVATAPMTATMILAGKIFPAHAARALPPQQITEKIIAETHADPAIFKRGHPKAALVSHFLFGAVMGGTYAGLVSHLPGNKLVKGMLFGAGVWSISYGGWLPLMNLQPSPPHQPRGRNIAMLVSHVVWGATLSHLHDA